MTIQVTVKSKNVKHQIPIEDDKVTVLSLKNAIASKLDVPVEKQRLVLKGKILSNATDVLDTDILLNNEVSLVNTGATAAPKVTKPAPSQAPRAPAAMPQGAMPNIDIGQMMNMMEGMFGNTPGMGGMFSDPTMRKSFEHAAKIAQDQFMKNPNLLGELLGNSGIQESIESMVTGPGTEDNLGKVLESVKAGDDPMSALLNQPDLLQSIPEIMNNPKSSEGALPDMMSKLMQTPGFDGLVNSIVDNIDIEKFAQEMEASEQSPRSNTDGPADVAAAPAIPAPSSAAPSSGSKTECMELLKSLGFGDAEKNRVLLEKNGGDVDATIHDLLKSTN